MNFPVQFVTLLWQAHFYQSSQVVCISAPCKTHFFVFIPKQNIIWILPKGSNLTQNSDPIVAPTFSTAVQESELRWAVYDLINGGTVMLGAPIPKQTKVKCGQKQENTEWDDKARDGTCLKIHISSLSLFNWKYFTNFPFVAEIVANISLCLFLDNFPAKKVHNISYAL